MVDGVEVQIPFEQLEVGQTVIVNAGETIPVDGLITDGMATVDQHILTGESKPVEKEPGDQVFALTMILAGRIYVSVEKAGNETTVAQIGQILNNTMEYKATVQLRAETLANRTVLPALITGGLALPILGPMGALTVLDAHFKMKMSGLVPFSLTNFLNLASQEGILIKDGRSLDLLNQVDTLVFDKTGTLTEEQPHVGTIYACAGGGKPNPQVCRRCRATTNAPYRQGHTARSQATTDKPARDRSGRIQGGLRLDREN